MAKKTAAVQAEIVTELPELAQTQGEATGLTAFLKGLVPFFQAAAAMERDAKALAERARGWKTPTTKDEDAKLIEDVRAARTAKSSAGDHWEPVTSMFSNLHRRMTGARKRTIDALDEAIGTGNRLHQAWDDAERARARREADEQRRQAEAAAAAEREKEMADLEAAALKAEASSPDLSDREREFVDRLVQLGDGYGVPAARMAGYKDPDKAATRLLATPKIQQAMEAVRTALAAREQAQAVAARPLEAVVAPTAGPQVNSGDRETWSAELLDEQALIQAILDGNKGIPTDLLAIRQTKLNEYARSFKTIINGWPGVRAKRTLSVVR